jgi:dihydroxyacetone kinase
MMKKLINDVGAVVPQMLEGLARTNPSIAVLDGQTIVARRDHRELAERGTVAIISGGGAGHEPAHAGYVGMGMLTAAVVGDVFTSPSTDAVLTAIEAVGGPAGVLLVVKNYTGDRLNFGLAAEIARTRGHLVEMVVVSDDVALASDGQHAGRRGIAGTVLVHKIVGAAAESGASLAEVADAGRRAAADVGTMGVALGACTVPAVGRPGFHLADDEIEWGLGIHGESGIERSTIVPAHDIAERLIGTISDDRGLTRGDRVALLVNNLGTTPPSELDIVAAEALAAAEDRGLVVERLWSGTFLTALDMPGCSISLLSVDDARLDALDAASSTSAWPTDHRGRPGDGSRLPAPAVDETGSDGPYAAADSPLATAIRAACEALRAAEPELTEMDTEVGDGDLGTSLDRGSEAVLAELDRLPADPAEALRHVAAILRRVIGGTSGPLYSILLLRAASAWDDADGEQPWAEALAAGIAGISEVGGASEGDRTMLDAMIPFERAWSAGGSVSDALEAAREGTAATASVVAKVGRSSYVGDRALGTPDPGARAVVIWLEAVAGAVGAGS